MKTNSISKENILLESNQGARIFEHYIPEFSSNGSKKNFSAKFRNGDKNPSANVYLNKNTGNWCYHDFGSDDHLSPIDFVMKKESLNYKEALEFINSNILYNQNTKIPVTSKPKTTKPFFIEKSNNYQYWFSFAPKEQMLNALKKYNVFALQSFSTINNGKRITSKAQESNPAFAFEISSDCYKVYRPNAKRGKHIWLGEKPKDYADIFGLKQLKSKYDRIYVFEGLKDMLVANANGIPAVGVDQAGTKLTGKTINTLLQHTDDIILCYDLDKAGQKFMLQRVKEHNLSYVKLPNELKEKGGKDISDFFRLGFTREEFEKLEFIRPETDITELDQNSDLTIVQVENFLNQRYKFRYNCVENVIEYKELSKPSQPYKIANENSIYRRVMHKGLKLSMDKLKVLLASDFVPEYDPFEAYFKSLEPWQHNETDYINKVTEYVITKDQKRFRIHFRKALVRSVACTLDPEINNKHALIIIDENQHTGKSTFISWLCPPALKRYITQDIVNDKDTKISLSENFMINLDELAILSKKDMNNVKALISTPYTKVRKPYASKATPAVRRANFWGSTNQVEILSDPSGAVRWLCFELAQKINFDYKKDIDVNNVWRQAYTLYKDGFDYNLSNDEISENERINKNFRSNTLEDELIVKHCGQCDIEEEGEYLMTTDILQRLSSLYPQMRLTKERLGKALQRQGFEKISKRIDGGNPRKVYFLKFVQHG